MSASSLLIELGTEELPVKALPELAAAFARGITEGLAKRGVAMGEARTLYSPRRLAVLIEGVAAEQPEQRSEMLGPYLNIGLDAAGAPTKALEGFAAKAGVAWTALERATDAKGERFVHRSVSPGARTADLLQAVFDEAIKAMPIPKPMRWGAHEYAFARPALWLVALHGGDVLPLTAFGHSTRPFTCSRLSSVMRALPPASAAAASTSRTMARRRSSASTSTFAPRRAST